MKKVLFIIAFLLLSFGISNACNYEFSSFGDAKKSISTKSDRYLRETFYISDYLRNVVKL